MKNLNLTILHKNSLSCRDNYISTFYRFYSTSHTSSGILFINSTPHNIVFRKYDDNIKRSVLILPSVKALPPIELEAFSLDISMPTVNSLYNVLCSLESGVYEFEFYLYFEDLSGVNGLEVYTPRYSNRYSKIALSKMVCNYGYFFFKSKEVHIFEKGFIDWYFSFEIVNRLTSSIKDLNKNLKDHVKLKKGVLLVISKLPGMPGNCAGFLTDEEEDQFYIMY